MSYRRYQRRGRRPRRWRSSRQSDESGVFEILGELIVEALAGLLRLVGQTMLRGLRAVVGAVRRPRTLSDRLTPDVPPPSRTTEFRPATAARVGGERVAPAASDTRPASSQLPYRKAPHLLSKGERALWFPLFKAVQGRYRIFAKVRLADVVRSPGGRYWFRKIRGYHVDFVLCESDSTAPLLVVELDDRRHRENRRMELDEFKDAVLLAAGLPVYRIPAQQAYDPIELAESIDRMIRGCDSRDASLTTDRKRDN